MSVPALLTLSPTYLISVTDADEEIFHLFTQLAGSTAQANQFNLKNATEQTRPTRFGSLGFLDSASSIIPIQLRIHPSPIKIQDSNHIKSKKNVKSKSSQARSGIVTVREIDVELKQDILATRYRRGDTGSIVWRASVDLAELLWYDLLLPTPNEVDEEGNTQCNQLLNMKRMMNSSQILELGSGTGCLSVLCHSMFPSASSSSWTCSDQFDLLANITRNFVHNNIQFSTTATSSETSFLTQHEKTGCRYVIEEIDWIQVEKEWLKLDSSHQDNNSQQTTETDVKQKLPRKYDLILAVDCLYNESLIEPFIRTMDYFSRAADNPTTSSSSKEQEESTATLVLIVSELRSDHVLSCFLHHWLLLKPSWNIFRVPQSCLRIHFNLDISSPNYVVWCGWKN